LANVFTAVQEKLYSKLKQIDKVEYDWLDPKIIEQCTKRLDTNIGTLTNSNPEIEKLLIHHSQDNEHLLIDKVLYPFFSYETRFRFSARVDILTDDTLWELKCTSKITFDHLLQLVIYAWIMTILQPNKQINYKIFNIRTGEKYLLNATLDELTFIVVSLLNGKYNKQVQLDDDDFVQKCRDYIIL
jgi:hypothetical protein